MMKAQVTIGSDRAWKSSGVVSRDVIRLRGAGAAWLVRDGMTVGEFLAGVPERRAGLKMLLRCFRAQAIVFEAGSAG